MTSSSLLLDSKYKKLFSAFKRAEERRCRRDFLTWLGVGTAAAAVAACTSNVDDENEATEENVEATEEMQTACRLTTRDARGPYWERGAPVRPLAIADDAEDGVRLAIEGRLLGPDCRTPLAGYAIDIWQADAQGNYHRAAATGYRLRGKVKTDSFGRYRFETIMPGRYGDAAGIRPAHIHVTYLTPGGNALLTTQLYFEGDPYLGQADYCTAAGTCNSGDANRALKLRNAWIGSRAGKKALFHAVLPQA